MTDPVPIDARGLLCPLPVLRLRKVLLDLPVGARVRMIATDPMAVVDVPHFCEGGGHAMVGMRALDGGGHEFTVERGLPSPPDARSHAAEDI